MKSRPFFSIAIPTYNRASDVKNAIANVLQQDFSDFEIVISDNGSVDQTPQVCKSFKDKRIKYFRNKENIGFARNLYRVIKKSTGQYIVLLGDDDLFAGKKALANLFQLIKKHGYGYIRMNFLYYQTWGNFFDLGRLNSISPQVLPKNSPNLDIVEFIYDTNFTFISGLVFKNDPTTVISELENTQDRDFQMEHFWIKFIMKQVKKFGGAVDLNDTILAKFIINIYNTGRIYKGNPTLYSVVDGKIYLEKTWNLVFADLSPKERKLWAKKKTEKIIPLLPSVKYYSDNQNLLRFAKRMTEINQDLYLNPSFYLFLLTALFMPRSLWNWLRTVYQKQRLVNVSENLVENFH